MSENKRDQSELAWGVDFGAPAPQRRATWGQGSDSSAPARRGDSPEAGEPAIPAPAWTPIVFDQQQSSVDDSDVIDVQVIESPAPTTGTPVAQLSASPAEFEHNPAFTVPSSPSDQFVHEPISDALDLFADEPDCAATNAAPQPADAADTSEDADNVQEPTSVEPAELNEDGQTPQDGPPGHQAAAPQSGDDTSLEREENASSFHLPAVKPAVANVAALATPSDLTDMFDGDFAPAPQPPQPAGPTQVVTATGTDFASRKAALQAARAASAAQTFAAPVAASDALSARYLNAERYYDHVDRLLALGQSGDPAIQAMLRGFLLTRSAEVDAAQRRDYQDAMVPLMQANYVQFESPSDYEPILDMAYDELIGIGPLGPLWRDDNVTEIMVSGPDKVTVERDGKLQMTPVKFRDAGHLERTARDLSQRVDDRAASRNNPLVTAQLPGARVQFVMRPIAATAGTLIVIRKFRELFGVEDLLKFGSLNEQMAMFLCDAISARATVLVSGGTGSGKTTMINALSSFIPDTERVVTIEDALELQLSNTHVESLLTKESASGDDQLLIGQAELLRATLRMRPDRIIVGEIRDGRGCSVMLQAANTGHDGTMTTVHANTPDMAIERMADLLREERPLPDDVAKNQVTSAINLVVQIVRKRGRRYVSAISAVSNERHNGGHRQLTIPLFVGEFPTTARSPQFAHVGSLGSDTELAQKMLDAGYDPTVWEKTP